MASVQDSADTRRSPRRRFDRAVGVLRRGRYLLAQAVQISEGGLAFMIDDKMEIGENLVVTLIVPGGVSLVMKGQVIHDRGATGRLRGYGIRFDALDLFQRRTIRGYVSAKTQAEAEDDA